MDERRVKVEKLDALTREDEEFGRLISEAAAARDTDKILQLAAEKGIEFSPDELVMPDIENLELDEAELEAITGGITDRGEQQIEQCGNVDAFFCGFVFLTSLWMGSANE